MKWFQFDADMPSDPAMRRVRRVFGTEGIGALTLIWCFIAGHGSEMEPGRAINSKGQPYTDDDFAAVCEWDIEPYRQLRDLCLQTGHFDREAFESRGEIFLPAMRKRADEWTKKLLRREQQRLAKDGGDLPLDLLAPKPAAPRKPAYAADLMQWFESVFWVAYPRRESKQDAIRAMQKLNPDASLRARMLAALTRYKESEQWTRGVIPHPSTWINKRRWDDELPPRPSSGGGSSSPLIDLEIAESIERRRSVQAKEPR